MTRRTTDALIEELGRGLRPVRPIPRLRVVLAIAVLLAGVGASWDLVRVGPRPDLSGLLARSLSFAAIAAGLVLLAAGATLWVTGSSVPGRERVAAIGRALSIAGGALALLIAPLSVLLAAHDPARLPVASDVGCLIASILLGLVPALWLVVFTRWAAPPRLTLTGAAGISAGVAAGALAIHASCPASEAWHWVFGHAVAPLLAALLALPLFALVRRLRGSETVSKRVNLS